MPFKGPKPAATPAPVTPRRGGFRGPKPLPPPEAQDGDDATSSGLMLALGALGLGAGAAVMKNPAMAKSAVGKAAKALNVGRMTSMLSGLAVPKSVLGNVGAVVIEAAERKSTAPLKQFFSKQTARDFKEAFKAGGQVGPVPGASRWNPFGRVMGAGDVATQNALQRAGLTSQESARSVLQAPLPTGLADALENPVMQYLIPFRRTPLNQLIEGGKTFRFEHPAVLAATTAAGGVHGAATADERYPLTLGIGTAAAAKYGLPYAIGAYLGRKAAGAKTGGSALTSALPFSEYGFETALTDPLKPFTSEGPAGVKVLKRFFGK